MTKKKTTKTGVPKVEDEKVSEPVVEGPCSNCHGLGRNFYGGRFWLCNLCGGSGEANSLGLDDKLTLRLKMRSGPTFDLACRNVADVLLRYAYSRKTLPEEAQIAQRIARLLTPKDKP